MKAQRIINAAALLALAGLDVVLHVRSDCEARVTIAAVIERIRAIDASAIRFDGPAVFLHSGAHVSTYIWHDSQPHMNFVYANLNDSSS